MGTWVERVSPGCAGHGACGAGVQLEGQWLDPAAGGSAANWVEGVYACEYGAIPNRHPPSPSPQVVKRKCKPMVGTWPHHVSITLAVLAAKGY